MNVSEQSEAFVADASKPSELTFRGLGIDVKVGGAGPAEDQELAVTLPNVLAQTTKALVSSHDSNKLLKLTCHKTHRSSILITVCVCEWRCDRIV